MNVRWPEGRVCARLFGALACLHVLASPAAARPLGMEDLRALAGAASAAADVRLNHRLSGADVLVLEVALPDGRRAPVQVSIDDDGRLIWLDLQLSDDPLADPGMSLEAVARLQGRLAPAFSSADEFGLWLSLALPNRDLGPEELTGAARLLADRTVLFLSHARAERREARARLP